MSAVANSNSRTPLEHALDYAARGWYVLPIMPRGKLPATSLVLHGKNDATTDFATIRAWWSEMPDAGVGIALKPSGLVVVDVDQHNEEHSGLESLAELVKECGPLPSTVTAVTGGDGYHYLFRAPDIDTITKLKPSIELLNNHYIVAAPSVHAKGKSYQWREGCAPGQIELADLPPAWIERAKRKPPAPAPVVHVPHVDRDQVMKRASAYLARMPPAISGQHGHDATFEAACVLVKGFDLSLSDAYSLLASEYNPRCDPPWSERDLYRKVTEAEKSPRERGYLLENDAWQPDPRISYREQPRNDERHPNAEPVAETVAPRWLDAEQLADSIEATKDEPWVELRLGNFLLVRVRLGGIPLLNGGTGSGKTSLAASLLLEHTRLNGPAIVWSLELPGDELAARAIGIRTGRSWEDVLRGGVDRAAMVEALGPRLRVIPRRIQGRATTLADVAAAIADYRVRFPGQPILLAIDYVQIVDSQEREIRLRVSDAMARIDDLARSSRVVALVLSQGSRASSRGLKSGELLGHETTDAGAEAAALERWSTTTIAIGGHGPVGDDGVCDVPISIGKGRMKKGDVVHPARYHGESGRYWLAGEARPAADVRAEKATAREAKNVSTATHAIRDLLGKAAAPMPRRSIRADLGLNDAVVLAAVKALLSDPDSGVVEVGPPVRGHWPVWTRDRAQAAGRVIRPQGGH